MLASRGVETNGGDPAKMRPARVLVAAFMAALCTPALAESEVFGSFSIDAANPGEIRFEGPILPNTPLDLRRAMRAAPDATEIVLDSDGGVVDAALIMAYMIHDAGLGTRIKPADHCWSACAFMFFAGSARTAEGRLGVHQLAPGSRRTEEVVIGLDQVRMALSDFGIAADILDLMMRTPHRGMYVFSGQDLQLWGLVTESQAAPTTP